MSPLLTQSPDQSTRPPRRGFLKSFAALRNQGCRWYFFSGMGMTAGQGIQQLAMAWLILELTDSIGQLGLMIFLRGVPMAALGLVGGVLADRYNRRHLLISNQLITMVNLLILSVLIFSDLAEVWHVYVSSILLGITMALTTPARQAMIRSLVHGDDMMNAVALNSMQMNGSDNLANPRRRTDHLYRLWGRSSALLSLLFSRRRFHAAGAQHSRAAHQSKNLAD